MACTGSYTCKSKVEHDNVENQTNTTTSCLPISKPAQYQLEVPTFSIGQEQLSKLVDHSDTEYLHFLGGVCGIAAALETDLQIGICGDCKDLHRRREVFGLNLNLEANSTPVSKRGYLHQLTMDAFKDTTVILLLCCATLSLVLGIKRNGIEEGVLDGAIIFFAILVVVYISVLSKFWKNTRLKSKLSRKKNVVKVLRGGRMQQIANSEVLVGDIVCLTNGERVPADGLFVHGKAFKLDDDPSCEEEEDFKHHEFPFMFTGAKVIGGECHMLVTSVGENTEMRKMMKSISSDQNKESELQIAVDKMNFRLEKIWLSLSLLVLLVQLIRCFTWERGWNENLNPDPKGVKNTTEEIMNEFTKIIKKRCGRVNGRLVVVLCILVFAVRDGLPLGIFISFVYASRKMMPYPAIIRKLPACATIGSITTICTGKMGDLTLHPLTSEVKEAVEACKEFGVKIKLVVGDNMNTARLMAINSRILNPEEDLNGAVVEASEFRNSSVATRAVMIDKICVMANASPSDKLLMVQCLKQKGEVVAVTGTCSRDSPSLKEADVGVLLGERSVEAAKEASDIVILDTNFTTFTAILKWGRCVSNNIQKIIQVQLTSNIAAFSINLIAALCFTEAPLTAFQVLWVNLIMNVVGALALTVKLPLAPPSNVPPAGTSESSGLTSMATWRNIIVPVVYQVAISWPHEEYFHEDDQKVTKAMIFNTYVLCQVFVLLNAGKIDKASVFEGMKTHQSHLFFMILGAIVILQVAVTEVVTVVNNMERLLDLKKWCICVGVAAMSLPISCTAKWISWA